jgi:hypothetical protein
LTKQKYESPALAPQATTTATPPADGTCKATIGEKVARDELYEQHLPASAPTCAKIELVAVSDLI